MKRMLSSSPIYLLGLVAAPAAFAQSASLSASGSTTDGTTAQADAAGDAKTEQDASTTAEKPVGNEIPYMKRFLPENNSWELGIFGGAMFPSQKHELYAPGNSGIQQGFKTAGEFGFRVGYYPLAFLGLELEGAALPSSAKDGTRAGLWTGRAHLLAQLPIASIQPFVLAGGGFVGADSDAMGSDIDPSLTLGVGAKFALDEYIGVRLDLRDNLFQKTQAKQGALTHSPEILVGITFTPVRRKPDADGDGFNDFRDKCPREAGEHLGCPPPDSDGDGVNDDLDECPDVAGQSENGCPVQECAVKDSDGDGMTDERDKCPTEAAATADGCPTKDSDGDGIEDGLDKCPNEAADTEDGCLTKDADQDGIADDVDKCPDQAENHNGFEDTDGCPDEIPEAVQKFEGTMEGITFEYSSAKITWASRKTLDDAAKTLKEYPELRIEISGHSDSSGDAEANRKLSQERADSVKSYLVEAGVEDSRVKTVGYGPDKPVADNATPDGRSKNRRIEFHLIPQ